MRDSLSEKLKNLANGCPFPIYVVGGAVRDFIAGLSPSSDMDICAPVTAEAFAERARAFGFTVDAVYKNTGTVKISCGGESYEFASFRSDSYVRGEHRPSQTFFTDDIRLDARRRDFKCNAVYYDVAADVFADPLGGIGDITNKRITTVAEAGKVFGEDGLRLMRLARISAQTGFLPTGECIEGARANAGLIRDVAAERIYAELDMILHADEKYGLPLAHYSGLKMLERIGVLGIILPELTAGAGVVQRKDFHKYDVLEHSLRAAAYSDPSIRLAALLHDIGKPYCLETNGNFVGHDEAGAMLAERICERFKVPKKLAVETERLIRLHMYDFRLDAKENKVRKFILENADIFDKFLLIKQADYSACKDDTARAPAVVKFSKIYADMLDCGTPLSLKELAVKGGDMLALGIPAESVGKTLEGLLADCAMKLVENDRQKLMVRAEKVYLAPLLKSAEKRRRQS